MTKVARFTFSKPKRALHAVAVGDFAVDVGEQRVVEVVLLRELGLSLDAVHRDADQLGAERGELAREVAEVARLLGAARAQGRGVEEENDRAA